MYELFIVVIAVVADAKNCQQAGDFCHESNLLEIEQFLVSYF